MIIKPRYCRGCGIKNDEIAFVIGRNLCICCYNNRASELAMKRYYEDHARIRAVKNAYKKKHRVRLNKKAREKYRADNNLSPLSYRRI